MLRSNVLAAKARLAKGQEDFKARHAAGCPGVELCALNSQPPRRGDPRSVGRCLEGPWRGRTEGPVERHCRRGLRGLRPPRRGPVQRRRPDDPAPPAAAPRLAPLAERLVRDVFDAGLELGHSVRTVAEACRMATRDPMICTSLVDSRLLAGSPAIFESFRHAFRQGVAWRRAAALGRHPQGPQRRAPPLRRDRFPAGAEHQALAGHAPRLALLRWIGFVRYGIAELDESARRRHPQPRGFRRRRSRPMPFCSGSATTCTSTPGRPTTCSAGPSKCGSPRAAAVMNPSRGRRAACCRWNASCRSTSATRTASATWPRSSWPRPQTRPWLDIALTQLFGHRIEGEYLVGPVGMMAPRRGTGATAGQPDGHHADGRSGEPARRAASPPALGKTVRREAAGLPAARNLPPEASRHFLSLLAHPGRFGRFLRELHDMAILERFLPDFARARGLLQFNQYHKYTVDEHCIRAVEFAEGLLDDPGPVGPRLSRAEGQAPLAPRPADPRSGQGAAGGPPRGRAENRRADRLAAGAEAARDGDASSSSSTSTCG